MRLRRPFHPITETIVVFVVIRAKSAASASAQNSFAARGE